jgi:hypothetical protein
MDPYIEGHGFWPDFHASFIVYCRDAILERIPDQYDVRVEMVTQLVELTLEEVKHLEPDLYAALRQLQPRPSARPAGRKSARIATLEPVTFPKRLVRTTRLRRLRVRRRPEQTVVTVIEILSPSNKAGRGYYEYQAKRNPPLKEGINLVEINLLAGGRRPEIASPWPPGDYYALIARAPERPQAGVKCWSVRDSLPTIPIPLRAPDPDVPLDLSTVFAATYERARYARVIDYSIPPVAPLSPADRAWATKRAATFARRR